MRGSVLVGGRVLLVLVGVIAIFFLFFPARQLVGQRGDIEDLTARLQALETENARLAAEIERLEDPEELEVLARERLGLVRPGEQAYYFVDPQEAVREREADASSVEAEAPSAWDRAWSWLVDLVRGGA